MSTPEPPGRPESERPTRLDPERAVEAARRRTGSGPAPPRLPEQPISTRRYQWMIGGFGLLLVFVFSVYLYARGGSTTPGVAAGKPIHRFVAPLATSGLDVPANAHPRCNPARPARRGLNVCGRGPLVLAFFATGAGPCIRTVDTLQTVSRRFAGMKFAAVAINADRAATLRLVRRRHWTIPVAYDLTGLIGQIYGVTVCPLIEVVRPGGTVAARLIGEAWEAPGALGAKLAKLNVTASG